MMSRSLPALSGLLTCLACSPADVVAEYNVQIASDVEVPEGTEVIMLAIRSPETLESEPDSELARSSQMVVMSEEERTAMSGFLAEGDEVLNFFAFVDLDGNGSWDPGEPRGADPNNPVTLQWGDDYEALIAVEPDPA